MMSTPPADSTEPVTESAMAEQVLAELFEKYRSRGRGWTGSRPRRGFGRNSKKSLSAKTELEYDDEQEHYSSRRFEGIDWSLIDKLEQMDGKDPAGVGPLPTGDPQQAESIRGKYTREQVDSEVVRPRRAWLPSSGMYRSKTGTGRSRFDPRPIGVILDKELRDRDWQRSLATGTVIEQWEEIVGDVVAKNCPVESFENGKLVVQANSTAWAQQLQLLLPEVMGRIDQVVGRGIVETVIVRPPRSPSWGHGALRVPGRGPRDTYG